MNNRVLLLSSVTPKESGAMTRLFYDMMAANECDRSVVDVVFPFVDTNPGMIPDGYRFVPWKNMHHIEHKSSTGVFHIFKVKNEWKKYDKIHIEVSGYRYIIVFPFELALVDFIGFEGKLFVIGPDSTSMVFSRAILYHKNLMYRLLSAIRFVQNGRLDYFVSKKATMIYTVGNNDKTAYNVFFNRNKAVYLPHPVIADLEEREELADWDGYEKIRLLFAGSLSFFYSGEMLDSYVYAILHSNMQDRISVSFLGKDRRYKEYEKQLTKFGYETYFIEYTPSFEDFLTTRHILLVPLLVGGGTKNRVLTALGCGMDVIGSRIACENVYGISDIHIAENGNDLIKKLKIRIKSRRLYNYKGEKRKAFFCYHGLQAWNDLLWHRVLG